MFFSPRKASNLTFTKEKKKVGLLFTGGKDSTLACQRLLESGDEIACLITVISASSDSYMLHSSNIELVKLSSEALGIPLVLGRTEGRKEEELVDIKNTALRAKEEYAIDSLASGGLASVYQKSRIDSIAASCQLESLNPLWGREPSRHMNELLSLGYRFIITSVSAEGLGPFWLGREINKENLKALKSLSLTFGFNLSFEGGEAETLVLDCPIFKNYVITIVDSQVFWNGYYGVLKIKDARLERK